MSEVEAPRRSPRTSGRGTDSDAHLGYFNQGNPALKNMGKIIDGEDGTSGVTPEK